MSGPGRMTLSRRHQWILILTTTAYLITLSIAYASFIRSIHLHDSVFPVGLIVAFVLVTGLFVGVGYLTIQSIIAAQRAAAMEAQAHLRTRLLQMAAHELRNPMATIKAMLALMRRRIQSAAPTEDTLALSRTIESEVDRLATILKSLLEAFEAEEDRVRFRMRAIDLENCVLTALRPFYAAEPDRKFRVEVEQSSVDSLVITGDPIRLDDVLRNLLSNAVKYSPPNRPIDVRLYTQDADAVIAIRDYGIGIPKEDQERIFETFFRCENFGDEDPGGMGLGLFICQQIVRHHGGTIRVESEPNEGATFYVHLPLRQRQIEGVEPVTPGRNIAAPSA